MTAFDEEGIFSLRPLFYGDGEHMKFNLSSSNFSVRYSTFYNEYCTQGEHNYDRDLSDDNLPDPKRKDFWLILKIFKLEKWKKIGKSIFEVALIRDRKGNDIQTNDRLVPGES